MSETPDFANADHRRLELPDDDVPGATKSEVDQAALDISMGGIGPNNANTEEDKQ